MAIQSSSPAQQSHNGENYVNVASQERLSSMVGGAVLAILGLRRRSNLGAILAFAGGSLMYRGSTGHCAMYAALGKNTAKEQTQPRPEDYFDHGVHVNESVVISKPADELYRFWRNFDNLPRFMKHLDSVKVTDEKHSHWVAQAPAGRHVEWDAEIINDEPNKVIAWRSVGNADVHSTGSVRFSESGDGNTEVHVRLEYLPPAGQVGRWIAKLFGEEPQQQVREDLNRFKEFMETGKVEEPAKASVQ